jgi:hypothetical protein
MEMIFSGKDLLFTRKYVETWRVENGLLEAVALTSVVETHISGLHDINTVADTVTRAPCLYLE